MSVFVDAVYPFVLVACAVLVVTGVAAIVLPRIQPGLRVVDKIFMAVVAVQAVAVVWAVISSDADTFRALAYTIAALAMLPLLGISRLATPEAAQKDPERPVLTPAQAAKVDGGAAILVGIASAVVSWRLYEIVAAAA